MKKLITVLLSLLFTGFTTAKPITSEQARLVAIHYLSHFATSGKKDFSIKESFEIVYQGLTTYYAVNFNAGGFVMVAADDAVIPVLGYSDEGFIEKDISDATVRAWFNGYSKEIYNIVQSKLDNSATLQQWNEIIDGRFTKSGNDVGPLISSTWDQDKWYNYYCPADANGQGGKALAGCVATATGMIMKYYNFPVNGIGSHSYQSYNYGSLAANFGATTYNWSAMGTSANESNYQAIASLLYHVGVAVDMNYGADASGANSENAAQALIDYFNYDPSTIKHVYRNDYSTAAWEQMLRDELDKSRPIYYGGCSYEDCHAFVCDGYRSSDNRFHFNWGWSGLYNGYFAIGALSPLGYWFNLDNEAIIGIRPGNSKLAVRISNPLHNIVVSPGKPVSIHASVCIGTASQLKLYINDQLITSVNAQSLSYQWNTTGLNLGTYQIKVEARNSTDTVIHNVSIGLGDWMTQNSGFTMPSRGIQYIHAVDSSIVWAIAYDGTNSKNYIQEFTRTVNGGAYWTPGIIDSCSGLVPSMIFALNADTAYCDMYRQSGSNRQGIYVTRNAGKTWKLQSSAYYESPGAFPDVVHFFNNKDGWAMGDPIYNHFLCHTTRDGGTTWDFVLDDKLPAPLSGEAGITGYYSAVGDHIWFSTTKGRVYRSADKGYSWNVSATTLTNKWIDVEFANAYHGLAQDRTAGAKGDLSETFDGGITWQSVVTSGTVFNGDLAFVPGSGNTWVSTGSSQGASGASYSYDGGHSWQVFNGSSGVQYLATNWISNHCGWAGSYSVSSGGKGFFKFAGYLPKTNLVAPANLAGTLAARNVHLTWEAPLGSQLPNGYNVYKNNQLITPNPITTISFDDSGLPNSTYEYCISAVYSEGESTRICIIVDIMVGMDEPISNEVYIIPNPVNYGLLNIRSGIIIKAVQIYNSIGQMVYENNYGCNNLQVITTSFKPGIYVVHVVEAKGVLTRKIIIQ